jgi:hypothetical protein
MRLPQTALFRQKSLQRFFGEIRGKRKRRGTSRAPRQIKSQDNRLLQLLSWFVVKI